MPTIITCTSCHSRLTFPEALAGTDVQCPRCGAVFKAAGPGPVEDFTPRPAVPPVPLPVRDQPPARDLDLENWSPPRPNDFAALDEPGGPVLRHGEELPEELPGKVRAFVTIIGLGLSILVCFAAIAVAAVALSVPAPPTGNPWAQAGDTGRRAAFLPLFETTGLVSLAVRLATGLAFLVWFYNAHDNLRLLGARGLEYSPGWAVGYFFIPILSLFRPYQVAQEIYRASNPDVPLDRPSGWRLSSGSTLVGLWWAFSLVESFFGGCSGGFDIDPSRKMLRDESLAGVMVVNLLAAVAALITILMIKQIRDRQVLRYERLLPAYQRRLSS